MGIYFFEGLAVSNPLRRTIGCFSGWASVWV